MPVGSERSERDRQSLGQLLANSSSASSFNTSSLGVIRTPDSYQSATTSVIAALGAPTVYKVRHSETGRSWLDDFYPLVITNLHTSSDARVQFQ